MNEKYSVSDYGIFSDAITTTNKLKASIDTAQVSYNDVKTIIDNDTLFMGPCADSCVEALNAMNESMAIMTDNFTTINQYLIDVSNAYKAGDKSASNVILELKGTNGKVIRAGAVSDYLNPTNLSGYQLDFINSIAEGAVEAYNKYGVLPSLTLAQAILESGWGKHSIGNNVFGIKAGDSWTGKTQECRTSEQNADGSYVQITAKFRDYDSLSDSIEDHAVLLTNDRYRAVIEAQDYKEACKAVREAGYATSLSYTENLIKLVEQYGLDQWDPK